MAVKRHNINKPKSGTNLTLWTSNMNENDFSYQITEDRIRAYMQVPDIDKLRWLEELCAFTYMAREAPATYAGSQSPLLNADPD
ncbi:MAG: hypothetical protein AB7O31_02490 [Burkholderiales bacterium]